MSEKVGQAATGQERAFGKAAATPILRAPLQLQLHGGFLPVTGFSFFLPVFPSFFSFMCVAAA
jgi:hypothetical protein